MFAFEYSSTCQLRKADLLDKLENSRKSVSPAGEGIMSRVKGGGALSRTHAVNGVSDQAASG